jgi:hypothetical protein
MSDCTFHPSAVAAFDAWLHVTDIPAEEMTQSIASILDVLIEADLRLFMMCLLNFPKEGSGTRLQSAKWFLIYLYHRQSQVFLEICMEYLSATS